ncbi:hypothetical protein BS47DRAFT_1319917 [Hydnum rufescens UP504]|uniref:DDE-1 domain-containing protein n=1 Tax=Hydnum rufescens UP504 TaxID=1448309 RepID=A0A9P6DSX7_9AGAM|nr:hypothetical protein BS47DRAFT_1319917 [Hydnum rufescens UP504]
MKPHVQAHHTNWFHPTQWSAISDAVICSKWNLTAAVKLLNSSCGGEGFKTLYPSTLSNWMELHTNEEQIRGEGQWTEKTLTAVQIAHSKVSLQKSQGWPHFLASDPRIVKIICEHLKQFHNARLPISHIIVKLTIISTIKAKAPELLAGGKFKCSDAYVRCFLHTHLCWSMRTLTQAAHKLPDDWEKQCKDQFMCLSHYIKMFNVPAKLIINTDQTGVCLIPAGNKTWAPTGVKQVTTMAKEEKCQFTLMVASSAAGDMLPFQSIHKGKTAVSLPLAKAHARGELMGILWTAGGDTHWSSLAAMQAWVDKVLVPYIQTTVQCLMLPKCQRAICYIDAWSVHQSNELSAWMKHKHPNIKVTFVPPGTRILQPADVGLQQVIKHFIQCVCLEFLTTHIEEELQNGVVPTHIHIPKNINKLHDAMATWITDALEWLRDNPELVKSAWRLFSVKNWNLSYECLTSAKAVSTVAECFDEDPTFTLQVTPPSDPMIDDPEAQNMDVDVDDDTALTPQNLARLLLNPHHSQSKRPSKFSLRSNIFTSNESNGDGYRVISQFDEEELTDNDTDGETDLGSPENSENGNNTPSHSQPWSS